MPLIDPLERVGLLPIRRVDNCQYDLYGMQTLNAALCEHLINQQLCATLCLVDAMTMPRR